MTLIESITGGDEAAALASLEADPGEAAATDDAGVSALLHARYRGLGRVVEAIRALRPLTLPEAAAAGDVRQVGTLLAGGADPDAPAPDGFSPVQLALFFDHPHAAAVLLRAGADVDAHASHPMGVAAVHAAAASPSGAGVALAVVAGADLDATQQGGHTALHEAAHRGDPAMAELLLAAGADPTLRTDEGRTAADLALAAGHADLARRLR
jgi:ankyrin repeat protein